MSKTSASLLYLIGGNPRSRRTTADPLIREIFRRIGLPAPRIAYVGSASGDDREFFEWTLRALSLAGAGRVALAATASPRADIDRTRKLLSSADAVFIGGGEVDQGMKVLRRCGLDVLLEALCRRGKPLIGLSAGSIMLGRRWIRWPDEKDRARPELFPCLGCAPLICDTHAEGEDWVELKALLRAGGHGTRGYGIPAGACLIADSSSRRTSLGKPVLEFANAHGTVKKAGELRPSQEE
jgi:peptidase E